jgi:biopolymer transport protein ExbB/TolQ
MQKTAMNKSSQIVQAIAQSPFLWGVLGAAGFYVVLDACPADVAGVTLAKRYLTGHFVEYMETVMFAIGLAALVIKMFDVAAQRAGLKSPLLGPAPSEPQSINDSDRLLAPLEQLPERRCHEYYVSRIKSALKHIVRHGSTESLDDELKYLSDMDAARLHASYGLFRVIVWAIPILGFLGTVIGITMMLGGASDLAESADSSAMFKIFHGLALKFDTTTLALTYSILLMFVHFSVERSENRLLEEVDQRVQDDLTGRFAVVPNGGEGQLAGVRQLTETMLRATETLMGRQAELWRTSIETAARQWNQMTQSSAENVREAMTASTGDMRETIAAAAGALTRQAEVLRGAVEAAGEVAKLEDALNRNLSALAGSKHFEQTALSLAAAVNMLGAQLADSSRPTAPVKLDTRRSAHAA